MRGRAGFVFAVNLHQRCVDVQHHRRRSVVGCATRPHLFARRRLVCPQVGHILKAADRLAELAAGQLSEGFRAAYPGIEVAKAKRTRNLFVHLIGAGRALNRAAA